VIQAAAVRLSAILNDKIPPAKDRTVFIGGLSKNSALVKALEARTGIKFILPDHGEFGCALSF
jgi:activator of 2-hydroxyglutaryl-CoA dehydratase